MNAIVIYKSNTGFTKKYAGWIAEALSCKALSLDEVTKADLEHLDALIFGGFLLAGKVQGFQKYKETLASFKGKKAMFVTGAMPSDAPEAAQTLNSCIPPEDKKNLEVFYLQGGLSYERMGLLHKTMMRAFCTVMKKQKGIESAEYQTISKSFDAAKKSAITPLVEYIMQ